MNEYYKNDKKISYIIISKNNKHTYFRIKKDYLEISKSKHLSNPDILKLVDLNFDHFYNKIIKNKQNILPENEVILEDVKYEVVINKSKIKTYNISNNIIYVNHPSNDNLIIKKWLYQNYLIEMIERIKKDYEKILKEHNIKPRNFKFGYYKSKFGSYHRKNDDITLNVVLAKTDINFLYYVIMHEYAHTKVFNHSKHFYDVLKKLMPNYKVYDKKLKEIAIYI